MTIGLKVLSDQLTPAGTSSVSAWLFLVIFGVRFPILSLAGCCYSKVLLEMYVCVALNPKLNAGYIPQLVSSAEMLASTAFVRMKCRQYEPLGMCHQVQFGSFDKYQEVYWCFSSKFCTSLHFLISFAYKAGHPFFFLQFHFRLFTLRDLAFFALTRFC